VTPVIDEQHTFLSIMGERFLLYRMPATSRPQLARRSLAHRGRERELRSRLRATVGDFLELFRQCGRLELPESFEEPLVELTDVVTRARSGVSRDRYSREIEHLPEPEAPTRLTKQLAQLAAALLEIGVDASEAWRLVRKIGWDSVPAVRCTVLDCLARAGEPVTHAAIAEATDLPFSTAARVSEDLALLQLAKRRKEGTVWHVEPSAIALRYWDSERQPAMSEGVRGG
jgi:hypothetical protein